MSWKAHCGEVYSVEFSYDENTVYSIGEDGKVGGSDLGLEAPSPGSGTSDPREHWTRTVGWDPMPTAPFTVAL